MALRLGVVAEAAPGERRVALTPDAVRRLRAAGFEVSIGHGAGAAAWFADEDYAAAGAELTAPEDVMQGADVILCVGPVPATSLRSGQSVLGLLQPLLDPAAMADLAVRGVTAISLDGLPRTLSRAQSMDALTSQASVAGYKAVLVAADHFDRFFPLLITAAGTAKPAEVLVLGAGVAGLQAIGTARRLGAIVRGYDVRPTSRDEVTSLGAQFVELTTVESGAGEGGYARALTDDEQAAQQVELAQHIARHDVVITTAQVPGRRPPLMVTADAVKNMRAGSVIVDMGSSALGGNVESSQPGETIVTANGVTIVGAGNLASAMATSASAAYARNVTALLMHVAPDGTLTIDLDDEIQRGVVITHDGRVVHPETVKLLETADG
ncbi:MAG: Re/Si-specific NAD(P)(+) transhydrogenase subunit alpha [Actinomycetota bacterium]